MENLSNNVGDNAKMRIIYSPPSIHPLISNKIKIFVNSQLVESFSSRDTVSLEVPIQPGRTTITIKLAWRKQTIKSSIEPSKEYCLNLKYSLVSGKCKGRLSLANHHSDNSGLSTSGVEESIGSSEKGEKKNRRILPVLCFAVLIGIVVYFIVNHKQTTSLNSLHEDEIVCVKCGGTGKNPTPLMDRDLSGLDISDDCDLCYGTGWISKSMIPVPSPKPFPKPTPAREEYMECVVCHGKKDCTSCAGRGQHIRENPYSLTEKFITDCDECHGSGICQWCHGKGKTLRR